MELYQVPTERTIPLSSRDCHLQKQEDEDGPKNTEIEHKAFMIKVTILF